MKAFKLLSLSSSLVLLPFSLSVSAQTQQEETIVTASRIEQNINEVLASASIVDADQIALQQPKDLGELFDAQPSMNVVRSGGPGSVSSLRTRGTNSNHTLILINGMRFSSATLGSTQFQFIDPELINRVEIVRGSHSTLYGSEAIGGVVQLFTHGANSEPTTYVSASAGSYNSYRVSAGTNGSLNQFNYSANISANNSDGIDRLIDDTENNADDDAVENLNISLFGGYTFSNDYTLNFSHLQSDSRSEYDSAWTPSSMPYDQVEISASQVSFYAPLNKVFSSQLNIGVSGDSSNIFDESIDAQTSFFDTERQSLLWQNNLRFSDANTVIIGVDYYDESIDSSTAYSEDSRSNTAVFAQWQGSGGIVNWKLGTRNDDNESYGNKSTNSVAVGFDFGEGHTLFLSRSDGFKAPTFNDLYFPSSAFSSGNPDVLPEESENTELGFRAVSDKAHWEILVFHNQVENLIDWAQGADSVWRPSNVANAEFEGAEFNASKSIGNFILSGSASYVKSEDTDSGLELPNRSRRKLSLDFSHAYGQMHYGINVRHQGSREDLDAYSLLSVYANYEVSDNLSVKLKLDNLLDEEYMQTQGYNEEGLNGRIGIRYTF